MPNPSSSKSSPLVRILVPLLLVVVLGGVAVWAMLSNSKLSGTPAAPVVLASDGTAEATPSPLAADAAQPKGEVAAGAAGTDQPETPPVVAPPPSTTPVSTSPPAAAGFVAAKQAAAAFTALGSLDPASGYEMLVEFSPVGAGIECLELTNHFVDTKRTQHERLQERVTAGGVTKAVPMGALGVVVDNHFISLAAGPAGEPIWRETSPGSFEATVVDASGTEVFKVRRRYVLEEGSFHIDLEQELVNSGPTPLTYSWVQYGPVDLPMGTVRYGGDKRRVRYGYLLSPKQDPTQQHVSSGKFLVPRADVIGKPDATGNYPAAALWPNATSTDSGYTLVWGALTNRYFAMAVHPAAVPQLAPGGLDKRFGLVSKIDRHVVIRGGGLEPSMVMTLNSPLTTLEPGRVASMSMGVYAGPLTKAHINTDPLAQSLGLGGLVVYTFGGPCGFCTFQPITQFLRWFLGLLHDYVLHDWSLAIIVLVLCVRTILHPVTKWSQVNLLRFGKQMQRLGPKQKQLQERYRDDPKTLRAEMGRLMREEQVNYAGALGCLPMFLQTPIWIALFAMLYFTFELRHEPAFFGLFQTLSSGKWDFLADLAEPDRFIAFPGSFNIPLLSAMVGPIDSINILPLLLGVVFYVQQKYLTPPSGMAMSPEQLQQQRMMKIMSVVMFPLFMYNVPSGLALYTMTNSILGILETRYIRSHVDKMELNPPKKKTRKRSAFMDRMQQQLEAKQREMESRGKKK
ncbi:MAG: membrane protein insertase YidC [Phycisphaerales bacterium]|nr:membrane protein insertase YidC [Phycisphaerales bacterium]